MQNRDSRGRFLSRGKKADSATDSAPAPPRPADTTASAPPASAPAGQSTTVADDSSRTVLQRARQVFAQLVFGMTKVADHGVKGAANLAVAVSSMATARTAGTGPNGAQKAAGGSAGGAFGPNRPHQPGASGPASPQNGPLGPLGPLGSILGAAIGLFTNKLILILAPLTAFATILNSGASGFKVFLGAVNVLGATLAPLLLPVFVLLAAAVLTASDYIWNSLEPALKDFYALIITGGINGIQTFITWLASAGNALREFVSGAVAAQDDFTDGIALGLARFLDFFTPGAFGDNLEKAVLDDIEARKPARLIPIPGQDQGNQIGRLIAGNGQNQVAANKPQERGILDTFKANLRLSTQELRFQNSPKANFSGLAQASRNAQLAAVNSSPFERIVEQRMNRAISLLEEVVEKVGAPAMVD